MVLPQPQVAVAPRSLLSVRPILNTALLLTALGMVVRASGAVKEVLFARAFGVSADTDAFILAITYATFLPMVLGGAVATAIVAERARAKADSNDLSAVARWVLIASGACGVLVYMLAPAVMSLLFELRESAHDAATAYARILSPLGFAIALSLAMSGLLNSEKQFYVAGISALATPVFTGVAILMFGQSLGVEAAAWGMVVGALAEVAILGRRIFSQRRLFFPLQARRPLREHELAFWKSAGLLSFAAAIAAVSPVVDQIFLSRLDTGAISNLNYASKVNSLLIGLFGTAFGAAIYPYLSDLIAQHDIDGLKRLTWRLAAVVLSITGVTTLLVYLFSYEIVELLFARGNFTEKAVIEVSAIQQMFAFQLVFYVAGLLAMRVLNAAGAARFVLAISCTGVLSNAFFDWLLYDTMGARGIALASVLTSVISLVIALAFIRPALVHRV